MKQAYQSMLQDGAEKKYRMLEEEIEKDIVRRIQKAKGITSTADYQIQRYMILGHSTEDVEKIIRQAVGNDWADTFQLYDEVIEGNIPEVNLCMNRSMRISYHMKKTLSFSSLPML